MYGRDARRDGDVTPNRGAICRPEGAFSPYRLPAAVTGSCPFPFPPSPLCRLFLSLPSHFYSSTSKIFKPEEKGGVDLRRKGFELISVMAEICCETVKKPEAVAVAAAAVACEASTRAARRRRIEIRRFRLVSPADGPAAATAEEVKESEDVAGVRKRQKLENGSAAILMEESPSDVGKAKEVRSDRSPKGLGLDTGGEQLESDVLDGSEAELEFGDRCPGFAMTSVCGRRRDMEDAVSIRPDFVRLGRRVSAAHHFFGVYDGHGCSHVASSCRDRMHELVAEEMLKPGSGPAGAAWWRSVMERSFSRMDAEAVMCGSVTGALRPSPSCRCELQTPKCDHVGSTAVVAVVGPTRIVVSNCGDSRAVLCRRSGGPVPLSVDHKPDRPDELQRIEDAGGRVIYWDGARVLGVLAMSRAIGDSYLKPFVISEPEVTMTERSDDDECLILATDGLWDVVTNEMACEIVRMCMRSNSPEKGEEADEDEDGSSDKACSDAAILLTKLALARHSADNVSVVVIDLRRWK